MVELRSQGGPLAILFLRFYCRLSIMSVVLCGVTARSSGEEFSCDIGPQILGKQDLTNSVWTELQGAPFFHIYEVTLSPQDRQGWV